MVDAAAKPDAFFVAGHKDSVGVFIHDPADDQTCKERTRCAKTELSKLDFYRIADPERW